MQRTRWAGVVALGLTGALTNPPAVLAQTAVQIEAMQAQIRALQHQLDELRAQMAQQNQAVIEQKILVEQQRQAVEQQKQQVASQAKTLGAVEKKQGETGGVSFPNGRPTLTSSDGNFSVAVMGKIHFDAAHYMQGKTSTAVPSAVEDLNSGTNVRRAQLGLTGRVFKDFEYVLNYEFGGAPDNTGTLDEARISYIGIPNVSLEIGQLEPALTLEEGTGTHDLSFLEQAAAVNVASSLAAGSGRQAIGGRWWGERHFFATYLSGASAGVEADDEQRAGTMRASILPWRNGGNLVHLGASGSYVFKPSETNGGADTVQFRDRPELRVDGNRLVDTGLLDASHAYTYGGELAFVYQNLSMQGEYLRFGVDRKPGQRNVDFNGWYVTGSWVLTGESRGYNNTRGAFTGVRPAKPLSFADGTFGAFELAARYSRLDLDDENVLGGEQDIVTLGLNWYLNNNVRLMLNYQFVDVDRRNAAGTQIGQNYQVISARALAGW